MIVHLHVTGFHGWVLTHNIAASYKDHILQNIHYTRLMIFLCLTDNTLTLVVDTMKYLNIGNFLSFSDLTQCFQMCVTHQQTENAANILTEKLNFEFWKVLTNMVVWCFKTNLSFQVLVATYVWLNDNGIFQSLSFILREQKSRKISISSNK